MKQIITNIIGNAIKYTREGGQVLFSIVEKVCDREGFGIYAFTVEDTGIGMSKEFLGHIFEEFSREETATVNKIQGTGLGMSIVKKLIDIMDGTIDIESEKGKGTKIVVTVPMRIDMAQEKEEEAAECGKISLEGLKILLADDNEMNREIATELLSDVGAEVEAVEDGEEIVERVRRMYTKEKSEWYDVILTDIQMPKMDGYEATKQVRKLQPEGEHMVIIALSANAFAEDKIQSMESGMDDHLAKPIDVDKLLLSLTKFRKT